MFKVAKAVEGIAAKRAASEAAGCACNTQVWSAVETKSKCLTSKWASAGSEAKEILNLYRSGEATVGDVKKHATWVVIGALLFFAGEVVGRGSFVGYKESRD